ncbi:MAG TPA: transposase [Candidatus Sulfotelmatobacter sp.]|nr:transposase [Candidatus Sulfotelmatobacter sp.]
MHFITWSCNHREPRLGSPARRDLFLTALELMRLRYRFAVIGYVVMPEHVHLLVSEPLVGTPSIVVQAVKLGFAQRLFGKSNSEAPLLAKDARNGAPGATYYGEPRHFWQRRFYDFNVWSQPKEVEKLKYMHRNPVVRGLVESPEHLAVEQFPVLCLWRSRAGPDQRLVVVGAEDSGGCFVW